MRARCVCIIQYGNFVGHGLILIANQPNKHKNGFLSHDLIKQGQEKLFPYPEKPYKKAFIISISIPKQHCHPVTFAKQERTEHHCIACYIAVDHRKHLEAMNKTFERSVRPTAREGPCKTSKSRYG
jgi:hypothetical protein